ncbi:hypothetical protein A9Q75_15795 [Colwellia psychrerythraea]|uniref:Uncharacterized protein n=1 Tax=Colwellia psychrerythraea TaxID=28229 RepID=A0A1Y5E6R1_COLPS|nr:hypothetical protein A9Q75_15795 [Colwellia psychrerythraea]
MIITIMNHSNDEVMLLKRFFDGFKMTLYSVKSSNHRVTMLKSFTLPKVILIPTEILHFEW